MDVRGRRLLSARSHTQALTIPTKYINRPETGSPTKDEIYFVLHANAREIRRDGFGIRSRFLEFVLNRAYQYRYQK